MTLAPRHRPSPGTRLNRIFASRKPRTRGQRIMLIAVVAITSLLAIAVSIYLIGGAVSHRSLANSAEALLSKGLENGQPGVIAESDIAELPAPVQRWLWASNVIGTERASTVRLRQTGRFRQTESGQWMPFDAVQCYSVNPPASGALDLMWSACR